MPDYIIISTLRDYLMLEGLIRLLTGAAGGGGEGEEHGGFFVGACGVFFDGGEDGRGFAVRGGHRVVEGLEAPS